MNIPSSLCVDNPEIQEVINLVTGDLLPVQEVTGSDYPKLETLRMELAEANASNNLLFACPICMVGVYLSCVRKDEKRFFFKHRTENGNCPAITRGELTKEEIEARKYNAAKKTKRTFDTKKLLWKVLRMIPTSQGLPLKKYGVEWIGANGVSPMYKLYGRAKLGLPSRFNSPPLSFM